MDGATDGGWSDIIGGLIGWILRRGSGIVDLGVGTIGYVLLIIRLLVNQTLLIIRLERKEIQAQ